DARQLFPSGATVAPSGHWSRVCAWPRAASRALTHSVERLRPRAFETFFAALRSLPDARRRSRSAFAGVRPARVTSVAALSSSFSIARGICSCEHGGVCRGSMKPLLTSASVIGWVTHPCVALHASDVHAL